MKSPRPRSGVPFWQRPAAIFLGYLLLALLLTYPLPLNLTGAVPVDIGDPLLNTWILAWDAHALLTAPLDLFDANIFHPLPGALAFSEHLFSTALLLLPVQLAGGEPLLAYNLALLSSFPLTAFGMYLLLLHWTGRRGAAFIGGLIFGFAPYRFAASAHLQLLTLQWLPLALLFLDKTVAQPGHPRRPARLLALSLFLLLQLLAAWYLAVYTGLIVGLYLLLLGRSRLTKNGLAPVVGALLGVGLLTLPFLWPYLALLDELRQARPLELALSLAAAPTDFFAAARFNTLFGPLTAGLRQRPGFSGEHALFVGLTGPLLVLFTLAIRKKDRQREPGWLIGLLTLLISLVLTLPAPYAALVRLVPPASIVRVPARWLIPALFGLAILAGWGVAQLQDRYQTRISARRAGLLLGLVSLLLLTEALSIPLPLARVENQANLSPAYHWLAQQPERFALLELPLHSAPAPEFPEVKRLYASTLGWWPLVNGYSGYTPPRQPRLAAALSDFPDETAVTALQTLAAELQHSPVADDPQALYLLVHPDESPFDRPSWENGARWRAVRHPALYPLGRFGPDDLYQVAPLGYPRLAGPPLARFGPEGSIRLLAALVHLPEQAPVVRPAGSLAVAGSPPQPQVALYWQAEESSPAAYTVFIHLRAVDGFVRRQADGPPVGNQHPTSDWRPGEIIQDIHLLPTDLDFSLIDHLAVGLYDPRTGQRLPAVDSSGQPWPAGAVIISLE